MNRSLDEILGLEAEEKTYWKGKGFRCFGEYKKKTTYQCDTFINMGMDGCTECKKFCELRED